MGGNGAQPAAECSVIIPCWNDGEALRTLLERIGAMTGIAEIVLVDASEGDECAACGRSAGAMVVKSRPSRGAQLNLGARHARGEILGFTAIVDSSTEKRPRAARAGAVRGICTRACS